MNLKTKKQIRWKMVYQISKNPIVPCLPNEQYRLDTWVDQTNE